jgi:hypothetical protein
MIIYFLQRFYYTHRVVVLAIQVGVILCLYTPHDDGVKKAEPLAAEMLFGRSSRLKATEFCAFFAMCTNGRRTHTSPADRLAVACATGAVA